MISASKLPCIKFRSWPRLLTQREVAFFVCAFVIFCKSKEISW